jgi:hypothetical protein
MSATTYENVISCPYEEPDFMYFCYVYILVFIFVSYENLEQFLLL